MKSRREERRQKVLDELFELDPAARRRRLDQAVAVGDVRPDEVDSALRLVQRLDALSVFATGPTGGRPNKATSTDERSGRGKGRATASRGLPATVPGATSAKTPAGSRKRKPLTAPIGSGPERARRRPASAAMPTNAPEAASRLVGEDRAAPSGSTAIPLPGPMPVHGEPVRESSPDENWPSIAWLKP